MKPAVRRGRRFQVGDVAVSIDNTWLKGAISMGAPELSTSRLRPLWHEVANLAAGSANVDLSESVGDSTSNGLLIRSLFTNEPKEREGLALVRMCNTGEDWLTIRCFFELDEECWNPPWIEWSVAYREFSELEGGEWTAEQDGLRDGVLEIAVPPGAHREFTVQIGENSQEQTLPRLFTPDFVFEAQARGREEVYSQTIAAAVEIEHPPSAFLDLLPSIYREAMEDMRLTSGQDDPPFFERYLRGFEDIWEPFQVLIGKLDSLFDPFSTPPDYLLWLASWVFAPIDENWPSMKRRKLISEAVEIFRWRGTRRGLERYIELFVGVTPDIIDVPIEGMRLGDETLLGSKDAILGDIPPHVFTVTIELPDATPSQVETIKSIIEFEKPAHTAYSLHIIR